jgi:hypothetical protein
MTCGLQDQVTDNLRTDISPYIGNALQYRGALIYEASLGNYNIIFYGYLHQTVSNVIY